MIKAAQILGTSHSTIRRMIQSKRLYSIKIDGSGEVKQLQVIPFGALVMVKKYKRIMKQYEKRIKKLNSRIKWLQADNKKRPKIADN